MWVDVIVAWWSGGIASAVACKLVLENYNNDDVRVVFIDTKNEHPDTYRFLSDCEKWYNKNIEIISNPDYNSIMDVWIKYKSLNVAHGAVCSSELKRKTRETWQKKYNPEAQAFGFDSSEQKRAKSMLMNYSAINPFFPLIDKKISKEKAYSIVCNAGIEVPIMYKLGFRNNNCFGTGCVQGGIGYWQKIKQDFPEKYVAMSNLEHKLSEMKLKPVTICKDQSKNGGQLFLEYNPQFPNVGYIAQKKGRKIASLLECNGFCGVNDLDQQLDLFLEVDND